MPSTPVNLPPDPPAAAVALGERLQSRLRDLIRDQGPLPFAVFMREVLYAPGLGYYSAGLTKFGPGGDFVTAPEISSLFGACVGRQCLQILSALPGGGDILEFGAGSGALAGQVLNTLDGLGMLPGHYYILEPSADLRATQQAHLASCHPHLSERVVWLERLPATLNGVVLGNELLDALPVSRFRIAATGIEELCVDWQDQAFQWCTRPAPPDLHAAVKAAQATLPEPLPQGYIGEWSAEIPAWIHTVACLLARGAILLIDYGGERHAHYHPERQGGTLRCHYRHHVHADPLRWIGLQDITADVDFTAVAEAGAAAGLDVAGYTTQAHFLMANGLLESTMPTQPGDLHSQLALAQQIKTLTLPDEMGERFKVIALTRGMDTPLQGFSLRDLRGRL